MMDVPDIGKNEVLMHIDNDTSENRVEKAITYVQNMFKQHNKELSLLIVFIPVKGSPLYGRIQRYLYSY